MPNRTCTLPDCEGKYLVAGYCRKHYRRLKRTGTTDDPQLPTLEDRFNDYVSKSEGCWLWSGYLSHEGYGTIRAGGRGSATLLAHRLAYELSTGPIPDGMHIDHKCHTRACVRPDHLRAVTPKQNVENFGGLMVNNTSGVRGVSWVKRKQRWTTRVWHNHKAYGAGTYVDIKDAEAAVVELRLRLHTHNDLDRVE